MIINTIQLRAELATLGRRSLGVGYIGLAHYLAKHGWKYDSQDAWDAVHKLSESFQYFLLKSSNQLAKEKGPCAEFMSTKYSDGILPIDTYKKDVDEISNPGYERDWESLRESIKQHGVRHRHSVRTNAIGEQFRCVKRNKWNRPPRDYLSIKKSKKGAS